ncbi:uncharacterized protein LOC120667866 [Panicum virgatum]|uniref:uncharacterized protein LOC120667866 n=1 Tax=Panicum virgatum TaxID=38727 RepID=UPI0019D6436D|nr:uncharacterized protein LOC120667866 [Panicum virgatum]
MDTYVEEIRKLENKFSGLEIHHVDHDNNVGADVLSKLESTRAAIPPRVFVHELHHPSVKAQSQQATDAEAQATVREVLMIEEDWRIQFIDFIKEFKLPPHVDAKSAEATRIIRHSKGFVLIGNNLYKCSASSIFMKCVTLEEDVKYTSVAHPRANGQVERINGLVLDGLKKRLYDANSKKGGKWIQELPPCVMGAANTA